MLAALLPLALRTQVLQAFLETEAGEHAARMTAMDNATRNASDLIAALTLEYNRGRQAAITKELIEIVSGADHVHVLVGLKPEQSVASVVRELKGRTTMTLLQQFPELRVWLRGNLVWDERYAVETMSPSRIERTRERLKNTHRRMFDHDLPEQDAWAAAS